MTYLVPKASVGRVVEGKEGTMALLSIASFIGESLLLIKSPQSSTKSPDTVGVNLMKHRLKVGRHHYDVGSWRSILYVASQPSFFVSA